MLTINDYSDVRHLGERLVQAINKLESLAKPVAAARQIKEFSSDKRKRSLALSIQTALAVDSSLSLTAADAKARASQEHFSDMSKLGAELRMAEEVISEWEAARVAYEGVRSLLSLQKQISGIV